MPDDLPGLSGEHGAGKPLTRREWEKRKKARTALAHWDKGLTPLLIKREMKLRDTAEAIELVKRGQDLWHAEEGSLRLQGAQHRDLMRLRAVAMGQAEAGDLNAIDRVIRLWERMSRLKDLDEKAEAGGIQQLIIGSAATPEEVAGAMREAIEAGADVEDARMPWDKDDDQPEGGSDG